MPINFPNSPILNELYSFNNITWQWQGGYWSVYSGSTSYISNVQSFGGGEDIFIDITGDTINIKTLSAGTNTNLSTIGNVISISSDNIFVTGGTYNNNMGAATFVNNTGGTFNVTGFTTGSTDTFSTGLTYSNNILTISRNQGQPNLSTTINSFTGITVNGNSQLNGQISSTNLSGSTDRLLQVSSGGTFTATTQVIPAYITSGATVANLLDDTNNWDINGNYTGTTITNTFQGQKHYNPSYFFEAVNDNLWIRLIRG